MKSFKENRCWEEEYFTNFQIILTLRICKHWLSYSVNLIKSIIGIT